MKVKRNLLLKELQFVLPGLGKDTYEVGTNLVRFHDGNIYTYNHEIGCCAPSPSSMQNLAGAINGDKLYQFVAKAPGDLLDFKEEDGFMQVVSDKGEKKGEASIRLPWLADEKVPFEVPSTWVPVAEDFIPALTLAATCCAEHLTRRVLTCVRVKEDRLEGSDGMRAIQYMLKKPFAKELEFLLPQTSSFVVSKTQDIKELAVTDRNVWFKTEETIVGKENKKSTTTRYLFCSTMTEKYYDLDKNLSPPKNAEGFSLPFNALDPVLDRAKIFGAEDAKEGERYVDVSIEGQQLWVRSEGDTSRYEEWIPVEGLPEFSISLAARYLLDLVGQEQGIDCSLSTEKGRMWIKCPKWKYVTTIRASK